MKRKWQHPEREPVGTDREYWRGYEELEDTPQYREWLEREFPSGAAELAEQPDEESRRNFMKIMGASAAFAGLGLAGCRRPESFIVPYNEHVEWVVPGKPLLYATAFPRPGGCVPLVVTTHEHRPTKVDGNRLHPDFTGGSDHFIQASILDLYDPDRSNGYLFEGEKSSAEAFETEFLAKFREGDGGKCAILLGASTSPTRARVLKQLKQKYPNLKFYEYEPLLSVGRKAAEETLWGAGVSATPFLDRADRVLTLDADILGLDAQGDEPEARWAKRRDPEGDMLRLYAVEPAFTVTGGAADHRLRTPASQVIKVTALIAAKLGQTLGNGALAAAADKLTGKFSAEVFNQEWINECAADLAAAKGKSLVVAGSRQPEAVHILAALMNQALGSIGAGKPIELFKHDRESLPGIVELSEAIDKNQIDVLISLTPSDPAYDAPADLNFREKLEKVANLVHVGLRRNHTAAASLWHVPGAHYLESFGDAYSAGGVLSVIQPMIDPASLFGAVSELELLLSLLEAPAPAPEFVPGMPKPKAPAPKSYEAVRETFRGLAQGDFEKSWNLTLRDGFLNGSSFPALTKAPAGNAAAKLDDVEIPPYPYFTENDASYEVALTPSGHVWDGRYINNSWLQEAPDPITKLTWDNAAVMSIKTAERLGISEDGQMISITVGERTLELPSFRIPGHADYSISIELGYGQGDEAMAGRVGGDTGFNAYPLLLSGTTSPMILNGAKIARTGGTYPLAATAIHWSMEGRAIAREGTQEMFEHDPEFAQHQGMDSHIPPNISLYKGPDYFNPEKEAEKDEPLRRDDFNFVDPDHQWGMTIDLNTCIGCSACTIACQAENNIPVVGKWEVIRGREMHWIRMDRYFSSPRDKGLDKGQKGINKRGRNIPDDDQVEMLTQPVACVQCESAPCETVCPVNATVHTPDGLNAMTYNRCIGTRYCANNCPYKARRFNYFDYNKRRRSDLRLGPLAEEAGLGTTSLMMQKNPNVTVRMRGVIEKCTYCVQRIQSAKIEAKSKARDSKDVQVPTNAVRTACQDACPTNAIVFGNLKNEEDDVTKIQTTNPRAYTLLKYIGTRPRTLYLAKVRNPNPKMPGAEYIGQATADLH